MIDGPGPPHWAYLINARHTTGDEEVCTCRHAANHWLTDVWLPGEHPPQRRPREQPRPLTPHDALPAWLRN